MIKTVMAYLLILLRLFIMGWSQMEIKHHSPMVSSTPAAPYQSQAEQRLISFMEAWKDDQLDLMIDLVSPSWASAQDVPISALFIIKGNRTPLKYTIESISGMGEDNSLFVQMSASIYNNDGREPVCCRFMIIMNEEDGNWYVDPNSLAVCDVIIIESPDPDAPKQTPRTTVTPVPLPDAKLYFNPDGGSYYHADPECVTVKSDFLPLQGSFLYRDLKEYQEVLLPCLKCVYPASE